MKNDSEQRILMYLKMRTEATSADIAIELSISKEGARKHLLKLSNEDLITSYAKSTGVGRPSTFYKLTSKGLAKFPDTHAEVTVQLIKSVKTLLGNEALDLLINDREATIYKKYAQDLSATEKLEEKLTILSKKRSEEGYMAEWKQHGNTYYFIENHCPICAAAKECQGFCKSELKNFRQLLGKNYSMKRTEYILDNSSRCVYKIEEN